MQNAKFEGSAAVMLIIDTHIQTDQRLKMIFGFREASKRVNPSKSPLRKFNPKTILSLPIGKRK